MSREAIEEAIEVLEDASAEMLTETGEENYYSEAIAILRQALETETEALRLADALDAEFVQGRISNSTGRESAVELRRLHEVNQDLLKALNTILNISLIDNGHWAKTIEREAHEVIAKATGGEV